MGTIITDNSVARNRHVHAIHPHDVMRPLLVHSPCNALHTAYTMCCQYPIVGGVLDDTFVREGERAKRVSAPTHTHTHELSNEPIVTSVCFLLSSCSCVRLCTRMCLCGCLYMCVFVCMYVRVYSIFVYVCVCLHVCACI